MKNNCNTCNDCFWAEDCPNAGEFTCEDFYSLTDDGTDEEFYEMYLQERADEYTDFVREMNS